MSANLFNLDTGKAAVISPCGLYRYTLTRRWGDGGGGVSRKQGLNR